VQDYCYGTVRLWYSPQMLPFFFNFGRDFLNSSFFWEWCHEVIMEGCHKDFWHPEKYTNIEPDNVAITWNWSSSLPCSLVNITSSTQISFHYKKNQVAKGLLFKYLNTSWVVQEIWCTIHQYGKQNILNIERWYTVCSWVKTNLQQRKFQNNKLKSIVV